MRKLVDILCGLMAVTSIGVAVLEIDYTLTGVTPAWYGQLMQPHHTK